MRSSLKSRCIQSGVSFLEGLFPGHTSLPLIQLDNHLLRFYDECDKWQVEVADNFATQAEARALEEQEAWREMEGRVTSMAGVEMTSDLVRLVWDICRFERSWTRYQDPELYPVWCSLFTQPDLDIFQFSEDLKYYYDNGPVFNITNRMTQPLFEVCPLPSVLLTVLLIVSLQDIFSLLDSAVDDNYSGNVSILNFGHSDTVQPFMSALGLYYDGRDLLVGLGVQLSSTKGLRCCKQPSQRYLPAVIIPS